jgi:zinc/manganese transport system substrate-binding protein
VTRPYSPRDSIRCRIQTIQKVGQRPRRRHIIRQIKAEKIPAIFLENISDPRLMKRIAAETGAKIGGALYSDALSPSDGPAATYIEMMRNNVRELSAALAQ